METISKITNQNILRSVRKSELSRTIVHTLNYPPTVKKPEYLQLYKSILIDYYD